MSDKWTTWASEFAVCPRVEHENDLEFRLRCVCIRPECHIGGLLSLLFFVLKANDAREDETERARDRLSYAGWGALS